MAKWRNKFAFGLLAASLITIPSSSPQALLPGPLVIIEAYQWAKFLRDWIEPQNIQWTVQQAHNFVEQLNKLVNSSAKISEEFRQLRIDVDEKVANGFRDYTEKELKSRIAIFDTHRTELQNHKQLGLTQWAVSFETELEAKVETLEQYGPTAYQTEWAAIVVIRTLYQYGIISPTSQKEFFTKKAAVYSKWSSVVEGNRSYPATIRKEEEKRRDLVKHEAENRVTEAKNGLAKYCWNIAFEVSGNIDHYDVKKPKPEAMGGLCGKLAKPDTMLEIARDDLQAELNAKSDAYREAVENIKNLQLVINQIGAYQDSLQAATTGNGSLGPLPQNLVMKVTASEGNAACVCASDRPRLRAR
ncbi:MAG: hypothetical protein ACLPKB_05275 [Xanthobacteraceae bacterium]